jgi:hypothetical protein
MNENEDKNSSPSPKKESPLSFPRVKVETPEHREKRHLREQKELVFREKQLAKPPRPLYLFYLFFVLCLAYIVDEAASQIGSQFQSNIIESFFEIDGRDYTSGLALMSQIGLSLTNASFGFPVSAPI